jgi:hypothetical protein
MLAANWKRPRTSEAQRLSSPASPSAVPPMRNSLPGLVRWNEWFGLWFRSEEMMSDKAFLYLRICAALYVVAAVICFGPATVQSERAAAEYRAQCRAERAGDTDGLKWCAVGGPNISAGVLKALLWPLWLSYMAASR